MDIEKMDHSTAFVLVTTDFQYLEEYLRMYLAYAFHIVATSTQGKFPFKYGYESLKSDSLGKLVTRFKHFNDNQDLIKELDNIVPERNQVAHQGLLIAPADPDSEWADRAAKLQKLNRKLQVLLKTLGAEVEKLEKLSAVTPQDKQHAL